MNLKIPNPQIKQLRQLNKGDLFGEIYGSYNLDLSEQGEIKVNQRLSRIFNNDTSDTVIIGDSNFGRCWGFVRGNFDATEKWWTGAGSVLFRTSDTDYSSNWAKDTLTTGDGTPTDLSHLLSDMIRFEGALIVSTSTDLHKLASSSWDRSWWQTTLAQSTLTSGIYHPLHSWERTLLIGDANNLHIIDRNNIVSSSRITLAPEFYIMKIISRIDKIWILTRNIYDQEAIIFEWDGKSNTYLRQFSAKASQCLSGIVSKNGIAYVINSNGQLLAYTGSGFEEVASLPVFNKKVFRLTDAVVDDVTNITWDDGYTVSRMVNPNGMGIVDDKIYINLSGSIGTTTSQVLEEMLSGIWIYDNEIGLYHAYSLTQNNSINIHDYGTAVMEYVGAFQVVDKNMFIVGGTIYTDNLSTKVNSLFKKNITASPVKANSGFVIYSRILSSEIQNIWHKIWIKFKEMSVSTDKIVVKKRIKRNYDLPFRVSITWTSATTFTTTNSNFSLASVGNEIFVIAGKNSGLTAHITNIAEAGGTYTITIDETGLVSSGTAHIYIRDWVKVGSFTDTNLTNKQLVEFALGGESTYIDIKIVLFFSDELQSLEEITITSKSNLKIE